MSDKVTRARALRAIIEANAQTMEPKQAAEYPELFPEWDGNGKNYLAGQIVRRNGELFKVNDGQGHTSQPNWTPEDAHSLYSKLLTDPTGSTVLPWVQPDSTNGYKTGDRVTHGGKLWENTLEGMPNSWEPGVFGWTEVAE